MNYWCRFLYLIGVRRCFPLAVIFLILMLTGCKSSQIRTGHVSVAGGASLYYEECGQGQPLILLHGHSLDHRMWDGQFLSLAKHFRTIRFDFRGYGQSTAQSETFQFTHVDDLITLMDSLHIDKAHVVGLSMGAFVAGDMLGMYPQRMLSCLLASGGPRNCKGPSSPMDSTESAKRDAEIAALQAKGVDVMKREWLESLLKSAGSQREKIRQPLWTMICDWSAWQPLHKEVRLFYGQEAIARIKRQHPDVPTLMLQGTAPGNHYSEHPDLLNYLPQGQALLLNDCGHMLNMEKPEEFNEIVLNFIRKMQR